SQKPYCKVMCLTSFLKIVTRLTVPTTCGSIMTIIYLKRWVSVCRCFVPWYCYCLFTMGAIPALDYKLRQLGLPWLLVHLPNLNLTSRSHLRESQALLSRHPLKSGVPFKSFHPIPRSKRKCLNSMKWKARTFPPKHVRVSLVGSCNNKDKE